MPFISYLAVGPGLPLHLGVVPVSSLNDPVHILITLIYGDHAFKCKLGDLEAYYVDIELTASGDLPPEYTQEKLESLYTLNGPGGDRLMRRTPPLRQYIGILKADSVQILVKVPMPLDMQAHSHETYLHSGFPEVGFWKAVSQSSVNTPAAHHIDLPHDWLGIPSYGKRLLVRDAYKVLWNQITTSSKRYWVITGTPGIGKTFFSLYLMYQIRRHYPGAEILRTHAAGSAIYYPNGTVSEPDSFRIMELLSKDTTWHLLDAVPPPPEQRQARVVLVTSPKLQDWRHVKPPVFSFRYMPVWSFPELQEWNALLANPISGMELQSRYTQWGGVPRTINALGSLDAKIALYADLAIVNAEACFNIESHPTYTNLPVAGITGKALHIVPLDKRFIKSRIQFASIYLREKCMYLLLRKYTDTAQRLLTGLAPSSLRGIMFESLAHRVLLEGGQFQIHPLGEPSSNASTTISIPNNIPCHLFERRNSTLMPNAYNMPLYPTHAAIDSLIPPLCLLQMTTSERHPIKLSGIEPYMDLFPDKGRIKFIFVVPKPFENGALLLTSPQAYEDNIKNRAEKSKAKLEAFSKRIDQYTLHITVADVASVYTTGVGLKKRKLEQSLHMDDEKDLAVEWEEEEEEEQMME